MLNKNYIANNLCENRYRPQMHCNGNCILMKKMAQERKKENSSSPTVKVDIAPVVLSSKSFFASTPVLVGVPCISSKYVHNTGKTTDRAIPVFHPPSV